MIRALNEKVCLGVTTYSARNQSIRPEVDLPDGDSPGTKDDSLDSN